METSNDKRLVFGAMALFFFVFLESTLFFQTSLGMIVDSAAGSLLQFPIQGASALGLLLFSALNRITAPRIRSTAVGFLTLLGIASLACVAGGTSQALLAGAGCVAFFLIGLAGGAVYWAACNHLRTSAHFATYIGASHALGIVAQIPFFSLTPNRFGEALLLSASIVTLGVVVAKVWPEPTAARRMAVWQARSQNGRIVPYPKLGWKLGHLSPHAAAAALVALVLLFATLFNTLYCLVEPGQPWTSQYSEVVPRVIISLGGLVAGILFDAQRARFAGVTMFWVAILSIAAIFGMQAGMPEYAGEGVFFFGSGMFITFYTSTFIWIAPYLKAPALWSSMGRAISNITAIAIGAPALLVIQSSNPVAITAAMLPLLIGINALLFVLGMLDLRTPGTSSLNDANVQAEQPARDDTPLQAQHRDKVQQCEEAHQNGTFRKGQTLCTESCSPAENTVTGSPAKTEQRQPEPKAEQQAAPKEQTPENSKEHSFEDRLAAFAQRYDLTPRECDAVALVVCSEDALKQLAEAMGVSLRTLQKHLTSIYKKTDTQSRAGLTKLFWE